MVDELAALMAVKTVALKVTSQENEMAELMVEK